MKVPAFLVFFICVATALQAQTPGATYSDSQLDQMLGPIALYPDPLVALILPASTVPTEITLAAAYLAAKGDPNAIDAQTWDASVKALARYPDVVIWMNDNLEWTQTLGAAFAQQPADVMKSIQQLRVQARAAGTLVDTPQQQIALDGNYIRIVPTQPNIIYVPQYDPAIVYEEPVGYDGPLMTFGIGFPVGPWLGYECDWDNFGIWVGPWSPGWGYRRERFHGGPGGGDWHAWRPDPRRSREVVRQFYRPEGRLPSPRVAPGYHAPAGRPGVAPRAPTSREPVRPDFRGREVAPPRPSSPAPTSPLLGGYNRGTQVRENSGRGQASRAAPERAHAPPRAAAPPQARPSAPGPERQSAPPQDRKKDHP